MKTVKEIKENTKNNNQGSAMIFAIIVGIVLMVFCLSLLLVSYSLFATSNNDTMSLQCKELSKSLSVQLQGEIEKTFTTFSEQKLEQGKAENSRDNIWLYLRYNLFRDSWPYYCEDESDEGHSLNDSKREFNLNISNSGNAVIADDIKVTIYWKSKKGMSQGNTKKATVFVIVSAKKDHSAYTITSEYNLSIDNNGYSDTNGVAAEKGIGSFNPENYSISTSEKWSFILKEKTPGSKGAD